MRPSYNAYPPPRLSLGSLAAAGLAMWLLATMGEAQPARAAARVIPLNPGAGGVSASPAVTGAWEVNWWALGGGARSTAAWTVAGGAVQPAVGQGTVGPWQVNTGFWSASQTALPDLIVYPGSIFVQPPVVHAGQPAGVGARFVNLGTHRLKDVRVAFYDGPPGAGGTLIGGSVITIPFMYRSVVTWTNLSWDTSGGQGLHTLYAVVDPGNRLPERNEGNNLASRQVRIRAPAADITVPTGTVDVAGTAVIVSQPQASVALNAGDTGGSGLQQMRVMEFAYSPTAADWVQERDTDWISYTTTMNWNLGSAPGVKYLLAWFRDGAGNISWPAARDLVNYVPDSALIAQGQWHLFRFQLAANRAVTVTSVPLEGDPDLYVWFPDNDSAPDVWSITSGMDRVRFTAAEAGMYQVAVRGHSAALYRLTCQFGWGSGTGLEAAPAGIAADGKYPVMDPPVSARDQPSGEHLMGGGELMVYLPLVLRGYGP